MSLSPEEVEKPARIPDVATVMDRRRSASTLFSYFLHQVGKVGGGKQDQDALNSSEIQRVLSFGCFALKGDLKLVCVSLMCNN